MSQRWWEQDVIDLEGAKNWAAVAAESNREDPIGEEKRMPLDKTTVQE